MSEQGGKGFAFQRGLNSLGDLRTFYATGADVELASLPRDAASVAAVSSTRETVAGELDETARVSGLSPGTWAVEVRDRGGVLVAAGLTTVGAHPGERPVHGFATSFTDDAVAEVLAWSRATRATVVQAYDWMASYTEPTGAGPEWRDPSNRPVSRSALRALSAGLAEMGAVSHAYAPVYAVGNAFAEEHPEMLLYDGQGRAVRFLDQIVLANPGDPAWQRHFVESYGGAADELGFGGFHVDTYGYPRLAFDAAGSPVDMRVAYEQFLGFLRAQRPRDVISFNQVDGVPSAARLSGEPVFRYCEVWPPNDRWRHFEGLLDRSSGLAGRPAPGAAVRESVRGSIACYPPVWKVGDPDGPLAGAVREDALRTALCTEAIVTMLGGSALIFGDRAAALCDPYYPKHARLGAHEAQTVAEWREFALRCRDLFIDGEDTSWYEIGDENGSVSVDADAPSSPEPRGGVAFSRVCHVGDSTAVGILDLTGSDDGAWSDVTRPGRLATATVTVLVEHPERWAAQAAVLGAGGAGFLPVEAREVSHRQGRALQVEIPLGDGWAVLRVRPRGRGEV